MSDRVYYEGAIQGDTPVEPVNNQWGLVVTVAEATKKVTVASAGAGNGVLVSAAGTTAGDACTVVMYGSAKVQSHEALRVGDRVTSRGTDGRGKRATSTDAVVGVVHAASTALGEFADVLVGHSGWPQHLAAP